MIGFKIKETMEGYHWIPAVSDDKYPLIFTANCSATNLRPFVDPENPRYLKCWLEGRLTAVGVCDDVPTMGYVEIVESLGLLRYEFTFKSLGNVFVLTAEKVNIKPWNFLHSLTTAHTTIINNKDELVSMGVVFLKLKNILPMIKSFKLTTGE